MNQNQFLGILRAIIAWVGGIMIGHGLLPDQTWQLVAGVILTGGTAGYAFFVVHALTLDATLGVVRAAIAAGGGWLQSKGFASPTDVTQGAALAALLITAGWSTYAHRVKGLVADSGGATNALLLIALLPLGLLLAGRAYAEPAIAAAVLHSAEVDPLRIIIGCIVAILIMGLLYEAIDRRRRW